MTCMNLTLGRGARGRGAYAVRFRGGDTVGVKSLRRGTDAFFGSWNDMWERRGFGVVPYSYRCIVAGG